MSQKLNLNPNYGKGKKTIDEEKVKRLRNQILTIERDYGVTQTKLLPHQQDVWNSCKLTMEKIFRGKRHRVPKFKFTIFQGGNGVGKSFTLYYIVTNFALGLQAKNYGLEYIGRRKKIMIVTQSSGNVTEYVEPYLLGEGSPTRIPPEMIEKITRGSECVKSIKLTNGCLITIKTVEQGQKRLVGANPDMLVVDEPIEKDEVWNELIARLRSPEAFLLYGFTPINGFNASYYFLYEQESEEIRRRMNIIRAKSTENTYQDHTQLLGLPAKEQRMRIDGDFTPLTGLVYYEFNKQAHTTPYISPKLLGEGTKYVAGLDFGTNHPFGFVAIAIDLDGRKYIFDSLKASNVSMRTIRDSIRALEKRHGIEFERITADSAGARERLELKELGMETFTAKKGKNKETGEKSRVGGILLLNQDFADDKILIAHEPDGINHELVKELQNHCYTKTGDGKVIKENDDILDALRYAFLDIKKPKTKTKREQMFEERYGVAYNKTKQSRFKSY